MKELVVAALCVMPLQAVSAASRDSTEERIQRVTQGIVPPVLVKGESPPPLSLASRMSELKVPGVGIAVIHKGRIEWARGYGVTRIGGAPVTADTLFQAASISKPVFALAILHQVESGKLNLDADINTYLKQWKVPENEYTRQTKLTLRRLLSHSAGLTVHGFPGYRANAPVPTLLQILDGVPPANTAPIRVDITPGLQWRYSGGGYVVAQQLLEDVTGKPLPDLMRESVLVPLGMTRSTYEQPLPAKRTDEIAWPYHGDGSAIDGGPHTYPEMAPAGLWTTPSDLARYALGVQAALSGKSHEVISAATARDMLTPVNGSQGLGPQVDGATSRKYFAHNGANEGYRCWMVSYTDGEGAIVMTNSDSGDGLVGEVMRTIAHVYGWPDWAPPTRVLATVKPELLDRFVGAYQLANGMSLVVRKDGDHLVSQVIGFGPLRQFPSSDHAFFARDVDLTLEFAVEAAKPVTSVRHRFYGQELVGTRMDEAREGQLLASVTRQAERFAQQKPAAGSEAAVRELIAGLAAGKPDYSRMNPQFAELTRQQLPNLQKFIVDLGALKKLEFLRVSPEGGDQFAADFEKGVLRIQMQLSDDGKIDGAGLLPR